MFTLRYYCSGKGSSDVLAALEQVNAKHGIAFEVVDLSVRGAHDDQREKLSYESDFKTRARLLKKRTGRSITSLRSRRAGHYFLSTPGTIAIISEAGVEWYTIGNQDILEFLANVALRGYASLQERAP